LKRVAAAIHDRRSLIVWPVVAPLFIACLPGGVIVGFLVLKADEVIGDLLAGHAREDNNVFLATVLVVGALSALTSYGLTRINRQLLRLLSAAGCGLLAAAVAAGLVFWVEIELGGRLLMLSAQTMLGLLLLRAGCKAWEVVRAFRGNPVAATRQFALGAAGSLLAAALAGAVGIGRGLELSVLARPHWFYVLVVPAAAGFGIVDQQPNVPSKPLGALTFVVVVLTIFYSLGVIVFGLPDISCDMHIYNPHYEVLGFEWEPWRWTQRELWKWIFAPGALTELSLLHVVDPVPNINAPGGTYCVR
jgi:hypothetical protein